MISLTKQVESLERVLAKLQERCNVWDRQISEGLDPVNPKHDAKRLNKVQERIQEAEQEMSAIAEALSLLYDYAE